MKIRARALKVLAAVVVLGAVGGYSRWAWKVMHYPVDLRVQAPHVLISLVSGYTRTGRFVSFSPIDPGDCFDAINECRALVQAVGGGICKVPAKSLRLKNRSINGADYPNAKIYIERTKIALEDLGLEP